MNRNKIILLNLSFSHNSRSMEGFMGPGLSPERLSPILEYPSSLSFFSRLVFANHGFKGNLGKMTALSMSAFLSASMLMVDLR